MKLLEPINGENESDVAPRPTYLEYLIQTPRDAECESDVPFSRELFGVRRWSPLWIRMLQSKAATNAALQRSSRQTETDRASQRLFLRSHKRQLAIVLIVVKVGLS